MNTKYTKYIKDSSLTILYAIIFTIIIRIIFYDPYHIPSSSMTPILRTGDKIFVNKFRYGYSKFSIMFHPIPFNGRIAAFHKPKRGDIVVFTLPKKPNIFYIKRVVGLPGDKIEIKNNNISVNNKPFEYTFVKEVPAHTEDNENFFSVKEFIELNSDGKYYNVYLTQNDPSPKNLYIVPENHYFMMGDNRSNSGDSRFDSMGFIPIEHIVGKAEIIFFSSENWLQKIRFDRFFNLLSAKNYNYKQPTNIEILKENEVVVKAA